MKCFDLLHRYLQSSDPRACTSTPSDADAAAFKFALGPAAAFAVQAGAQAAVDLDIGTFKRSLATANVEQLEAIRAVAAHFDASSAVAQSVRVHQAVITVASAKLAAL